ncbi:hypothetical protein HDE_00969 [Halotydeus destructor]|nr:hypothetical protein HDE_00969 [Halotydeus destructor]
MKALRLSVPHDGSISWVSEVFMARTNCLECLTICFLELTSQLVDEILAIVRCSPELTKVNLEMIESFYPCPFDSEVHARLCKQLPQLSLYHVSCFSEDLNMLGEFVTSLHLKGLDEDYPNDFLESCKKLVELEVNGGDLEQLAETIPESVVVFKTNCSGGQFEQLKALLASKGKQLEQLEVRLERSDVATNAKMLLLETGHHCPTLNSLVVNARSNFSSVSNCDATEQFEAFISKATSLKQIDIAGVFISRSSLESCLKLCKNLTNVYVDIGILSSEAPLEEKETLHHLMCNNRKLNVAVLAEVNIETGRRTGVRYEYINGISLFHDYRVKKLPSTE